MSSRREIPAKLDEYVVTVGWDNPLQTFFAQVEDRRALEEESMVLWLGGHPREHPTAETMVDALHPYADLNPDMLRTLAADRSADLGRPPTAQQQAMTDLINASAGEREPVAPAAASTREESVGPTEPGPEHERAQPSSAAPTAGLQPGTAQSEDDIKALVAEMQAAAARLGPEDTRLKRTVETIAAQVQEPGRIQEPGFRTGVAYALQDFQKFTSETFRVESGLAQELTDRALTTPGLTNTRVQSLMAQTAALSERKLVRDIRDIARETAALGDRQNRDAPFAEVEALENRARLAQAPRVEDPAIAPQGTVRPPEAQTSTSTGPSHGQQSREPQRQQAGLAGGRFVDVPPQAPRSDVIADLVRKMRIPVPTRMDRQAPPPPFSVDQRVSLFEKRMAEGRTNGLIDSAERSGVAALEAAEQFITGPGRGILGKIETAASTEQGGIETVMREMQPDGRYANLRTEFDNAYQQDKIFAGTYDKMVASAIQFGQDRLAVENNFAQRGLDPNQLDGRFRQADEAISEVTAKVPGRTPGKTALEEMAEKIAEIFKRAYDGVKRMFGQEPEATPASAPSPSVSM